MNALNAFIRRMAVLSVLWAFCEMLLPERRLALQSAAREAEACLVRLAGRAGYDAQGKVWLDMDGALFQAEVMLSPREGQSLLLTADQLRQKIAQTLQVEESRITVVQSGEAEGT